MKRKKANTRKSERVQKADYIVELELPLSLLTFCANLRDKQLQENMDAQVSKDQVEDISISVKREDNRLKFLLKGVEDFPIHFVENKWCCKVKSVTLPEESLQKSADAVTPSELEPPQEKSLGPSAEQTQEPAQDHTLEWSAFAESQQDSMSAIDTEKDAHVLPDQSVVKETHEAVKSSTSAVEVVAEASGEKDSAVPDRKLRNADKQKGVKKNVEMKEKEEENGGKNEENKEESKRVEKRDRKLKDIEAELTPRRTSRIIKVKKLDDEHLTSAKTANIEESSKSTKKVKPVDKKSKVTDAEDQIDLIPADKIKKEIPIPETRTPKFRLKGQEKSQGNRFSKSMDVDDAEPCVPDIEVTRSGRVRRPKRHFDEEPETESPKKKIKQAVEKTPRSLETVAIEPEKKKGKAKMITVIAKARAPSVKSKTPVKEKETEKETVDSQMQQKEPESTAAEPKEKDDTQAEQDKSEGTVAEPNDKDDTNGELEISEATVAEPKETVDTPEEQEISEATTAEEKDTKATTEKLPDKKGQFKCTICGGQLNSKRGLTRHINRFHCKTDVVPSAENSGKENADSVTKTNNSESSVNTNPEDDGNTTKTAAGQDIVFDENQDMAILNEEVKETETPVVKKDVLEGEKGTSFHCPECSLIYGQRKSLIKHVQSVHCDAENYAEILSKTEEQFFSKLKPNPLEVITTTCPICGEERSGRSILKHLKLCHKDHPDFLTAMNEMKAIYTEQVATTRKARIKQTKKPVKESHTYVCQFCGRQFDYRPSRLNHEKYRCEHNPNKRKLCECYLCGFASPSAEKFKVHMTTHDHAERLHCNLCNKSYKTRAGLTVHKRKEHMICKKVPLITYQCSECSKIFYTKDHLKKHMVIHSDEMPFQCELCGRQFKTPGAVQKHQKMIHFNRYKFHCDKCGHGVEKEQYLRKHRCGHTRRKQNGVKLTIADLKRRPGIRSKSLRKMEMVHLVPGEGLQAVPLAVLTNNVDIKEDVDAEDGQGSLIPAARAVTDTEMIMQFSVETGEDAKLEQSMGMEGEADKTRIKHQTMTLQEYEAYQQQSEFHEYAVPVQYEAADSTATTSQDGQTVLHVLPESDHSLYSTLQALDQNQHLIPSSGGGTVHIVPASGPGGEGQMYTLQSEDGTEIYTQQAPSQAQQQQHIQVQYYPQTPTTSTNTEVLQLKTEDEQTPQIVEAETPQHHHHHQHEQVYQIITAGGDADSELSPNKTHYQIMTTDPDTPSKQHHHWVPGQTIETADGQQVTVVYTSQDLAEQNIDPQALAAAMNSAAIAPGNADGSGHLATMETGHMDTEEVVEEVVVAAESDYVVRI